MENKNKKGLKILDYFMLGFGSMIGVGWTVSINDWFQSSGGVIGTGLAFLIGTLLVIPIGLVYGEMSSSLPVSGGVVAYAYRVGSPRFAFLAGWLQLLAYMVLLPWEMIYINHVLSILFPFLQSGAPLYTIFNYNIYPLALIIGIVTTVVMVYLNFVGVELSGKVQTILTTVILIVAAIIVVSSLSTADFSNILPLYTEVPNHTHSSVFSGIFAMLVIVPFFLAGFDSIPQAIEEASDDINSKQVAKTIVFTIGSAGLFYIAIVFSAGLAFPWTSFSLLETPALAFMFKNLHNNILGKALYFLTIVGALAGLLTTWNGMFVAASRLLHSMGRAQLLPNIFSIKSKNNTPIFATILCGVATLIGPFFGESVIRPLTNVGSLAFVSSWLITCYTAYKLRKLEPELDRPIKAGKGLSIIILSIIVSISLIMISILPNSPGYLGNNSLIIFSIWLITGIFLYLLTKKSKVSISEKDRYHLMYHEFNKE